jgi:hypothetical protein
MAQECTETTTASIWDLNLLQVFATMFLARDTTTPLIFRIRFLVCCEALL